jgi:hypothetical protein
MKNPPEQIKLPEIPESLKDVMSVSYSCGHYKLISVKGHYQFPLFKDHARFATAINAKSAWKVATSATIAAGSANEYTDSSKHIALLHDPVSEEYRWVDPIQLSILMLDPLAYIIDGIAQ